MWVILTDDLVDSCQPGNDVLISGVLRTRWQSCTPGVRSTIEPVLMAHNVEVKNNSLSLDGVSEEYLSEFAEFWQKYQETPLEGRDFILSCLCPQIFGLYIVKLAVALILTGGTQRIDNNGKIRGDTHLLLVGDPGTGKSQFLKYAAKISQRSVLTSGVGTTTAGLTAAAVKDGGKWQLEAGALVLADGGICCIDEFSSIKEHDKTSIHEAMEQQTISVAKAGLVCKLSTQCSILAATNPKGKYNKNESLCMNTAMGSPLLSRFDIILILLDTYSEEWDKLVSSYILDGKDILSEHASNAAWSLEKMRAYFSAVKSIKPKSSVESEMILQAYYKKQRSMVDRNAARTTPRLLQSLVRLAQGHAKLMFRNEVLAVDALTAIMVMESSMVGCGLFGDNDALHSSFPENPESLYKDQTKSILEVLHLEELLQEGVHISHYSRSNNILQVYSRNEQIASAKLPLSHPNPTTGNKALDPKDMKSLSLPNNLTDLPECISKKQNSNCKQQIEIRPVSASSHLINEQEIRNNPITEYAAGAEAHTTSNCSYKKRLCKTNTYTPLLKKKSPSEEVQKQDGFSDEEMDSILGSLVDYNAFEQGAESYVTSTNVNKTLRRATRTHSFQHNSASNQEKEIPKGDACLSDSISTLSELNAVFTDTIEIEKEIPFNIKNLKKFAFNEKTNRNVKLKNLRENAHTSVYFANNAEEEKKKPEEDFVIDADHDIDSFALSFDM